MINLSEEEQISEKFKLSSPSSQTIVNWVAEDFSYFTESSRNDSRITTHNPQEMRNDEFLRSIMQNFNEKIHEEEEEGLLEE